VLFHELGQNRVLLLQLAFEEGDALLTGLDLLVGPWPRDEGRGPVLKELLEPTVEDRGVDVMLVVQGGDRNPIDQVSAQNRTFSSAV